MTLNREKGQCPWDVWRRERLMKRILILWLCILCCLFPLSACAQPEKRIEDQMNLALEQLDRPMGEAFEALDLPGSLEEAAKPQYCLLVENGAEVLGKQMNVVIMPDSRGNGKELYQRPTSLVEYSALLKEAVQRHSIQRLGFEDAYMTVREHDAYARALPCELVPAADLLAELRAVKDPEELEIMIAAQRIAEKALTDILNEIRPGVTEKEIAARLQYLMLHYGAEDKSFDPIVVSGPNGSLPHGVPSEKVIQAGEFVTMDFGCIYHGYCSDMTRTVAVGSVTDEMRQVYDTVLQAQLAGIAAARAGATGKAVDGAARDIIRQAGYGPCFGHSFGHGVGVEIHEGPNATPSNDKPLPAGAVISAEPGIYLPGKLGVRIEDVLYLTPEGCQNLTLAPKELVIL